MIKLIFRGMIAQVWIFGLKMAKMPSSPENPLKIGILKRIYKK
jgi:hypothetical protein